MVDMVHHQWLINSQAANFPVHAQRDVAPFDHCVADRIGINAGAIRFGLPSKTVQPREVSVVNEGETMPSHGVFSAKFNFGHGVDYKEPRVQAAAKTSPT